MRGVTPFTRSITCGLSLYLSSIAIVEACNIEDAHYRSTVRDFSGTANFVLVDGSPFMKGDYMSLHLRVHLPKSEVTAYTDDWFLFDQGSSEYIYLLESTDRTRPSWTLWETRHAPGPLANLNNYFAWGDDHRLLGVPLHPGEKAPTYIFLPELSDIAPSVVGASFAPGIFVLERCDSKDDHKH